MVVEIIELEKDEDQSTKSDIIEIDQLEESKEPIEEPSELEEKDMNKEEEKYKKMVDKKEEIRIQRSTTNDVKKIKNRKKRDLKKPSYLLYPSSEFYQVIKKYIKILEKEKEIEFQE